jgi:hypothetical protein
MTERLLHFIWQFQYFNAQELLTVKGENVQIISPGMYNLNQGPDFSAARIRIGETTWAGTAELHLKSSDWHKHHHENDPHYDNVILHVVWEHDHHVNDIPVIELKNRISKILLQRYQDLMDTQSFIPCEKSIGNINPLILRQWRDRLLVERLMRKTAYIPSFLEQTNHHWDEVYWWILARNFGLPVNADLFERLAKTISVKLIANQRQQIHQLEALLFGQVGILNKNFEEAYPQLLQQEYRHLKRKYGLEALTQPLSFLRMRPGNFPSIRLAQLAMLLTKNGHLFSSIRDVTSLQELRQVFHITANDYWHYHYRFDEPTTFLEKQIGSSMCDSLLLNAVIPVVFTYGVYQADQAIKDRALEWMEHIRAESNSVTRGFVRLGVQNKNACDSQTLIEMKNEYCNKRRCLDCAVGNSILKHSHS